MEGLRTQSAVQSILHEYNETKAMLKRKEVLKLKSPTEKVCADASSMYFLFVVVSFAFGEGSAAQRSLRHTFWFGLLIISTCAIFVRSWSWWRTRRTRRSCSSACWTRSSGCRQRSAPPRSSREKTPSLMKTVSIQFL